MSGLITYDCKDCEKNPVLYRFLGHDGPPENYYDRNAVTGEPLLECPMRTLLRAPDASLRELIRMEQEYFPMFESGFLLESGGVADQSARYLAYMREIGSMRRAVQTAYDGKNAPPEK